MESVVLGAVAVSAVAVIAGDLYTDALCDLFTVAVVLVLQMLQVLSTCDLARGFGALN